MEQRQLLHEAEYSSKVSAFTHYIEQQKLRVNLLNRKVILMIQVRRHALKMSVLNRISQITMASQIQQVSNVSQMLLSDLH